MLTCTTCSYFIPLDTQMIAPSTTVVQVSATTKDRFNGFAGLSAEGIQVQKSAEFTCMGHQWRLDLYPGVSRTAAPGMVSFNLCNLSDQSINVKCDLIIKNCQERRFVQNWFLLVASRDGLILRCAQKYWNHFKMGPSSWRST